MVLFILGFEKLSYILESDSSFQLNILFPIQGVSEKMQPTFIRDSSRNN